MILQKGTYARFPQQLVNTVNKHATPSCCVTEDSTTSSLSHSSLMCPKAYPDRRCRSDRVPFAHEPSHRNQVLSDALARLTAVDTESSTAVHFPAATLVPGDDAVGRLVGSVLSTPSLPTVGRREEGENTDNRGNGFPAIPRLDGGRERVVSLEGECYTGAAIP